MGLGAARSCPPRISVSSMSHIWALPLVRRGQADHRGRPWRGAPGPRAATQNHAGPGDPARPLGSTKSPCVLREDLPPPCRSMGCIMIPRAPRLPAPGAPPAPPLGVIPVSPGSALSRSPGAPIPAGPPERAPHPIERFFPSRRCTSALGAIYFFVDRRGSPSPGPSEGDTSHSEPRFPFISTGRV